jgi:hypothetical protein
VYNARRPQNGHENCTPLFQIAIFGVQVKQNRKRLLNALNLSHRQTKIPKTDDVSSHNGLFATGKIPAS